MSDLLAIGATGVRAYQTALTTVSENISNTGTVGYTHRKVDLTELSAGTGSVAGPHVDGFGVAANTLSRSVDEVRAQTVRDAGTDLARTTTGIKWLDSIETALSGNQLGQSLTSFFNSAKAIAADPTAATPRSAFLESADSVANAFARTGKAIDAIKTDLDTTASSAVTSVTDLGAVLAKINDGLARTAPKSNASLQLLDQRDQALEQLSTLTDIAIKKDELGRVQVNLGGVGGPTLVVGTSSASVSYARVATAVSFAVTDDYGTYSLTPSGGVLAGIGEGAQRIADTRTEIDRIATGFATTVNAIQAQGRDQNGAAGQPLFAVGATATDLSAVLTDPRGVAAAAVGGGPRDNSNLAALESARTTGAFEADTTALTTANATALSARKSVADAQTSIRDGAVAQRDAVSGVNLDSEAVDLLRFQQAYQASSRVIQVARETFQSIIDII